MELWNAYKRDGTRTEEILIRGEPIPAGRYHLVCGVLVRHRDGSYLCMKRAMSKPNYPGCYEATAGGSALLGEDRFQCVRRELKEETGLDGEEFREIGRILREEDHCIFYSFVCTVDCEKAAVTLQEGETEGYKWMTEAEFIRFVNSGEMIDGQRERYDAYLREMGYIW